VLLFSIIKRLQNYEKYGLHCPNGIKKGEAASKSMEAASAKG
jgi:hypothetical protein